MASCCKRHMTTEQGKPWLAAADALSCLVLSLPSINCEAFCTSRYTPFTAPPRAGSGAWLECARRYSRWRCPWSSCGLRRSWARPPTPGWVQAAMATKGSTNSPTVSCGFKIFTKFWARRAASRWCWPGALGLHGARGTRTNLRRLISVDLQAAVPSQKKKAAVA